MMPVQRHEVGRQLSAMIVGIEQRCLADLAEVAGALHAIRGFTCAAPRRLQQYDEQEEGGQRTQCPGDDDFL